MKKKIFLQLHAVCTYLYKAMKFYTVNVIHSHFWTKKKVAMKNQKCITHSKPKKPLPSFVFLLFFLFTRVDVNCEGMSVCTVQKIIERLSSLLHIFFHCIGTLLDLRECACTNDLY